jgi:hypothetical protein
MLKGCVLPMNKKAWEAKFKKDAVLSGVNEPKKSCHGVRKARVEITAYADCTESQMMAMFGWTDPKMLAHYIASEVGYFSPGTPAGSAESGGSPRQHPTACNRLNASASAS